jgi:hypothetical protein
MTTNVRALKSAKLKKAWDSLTQFHAPENKLTEKERERLVVILPRGEAIRNFVYTGALNQIENDIDVTLLTVMPNDDVAALLHSHYKNVLPLENIKEHNLVKGLREVLDMAHGCWLWSEAAKHRWRYHDHEAKTTGRTLNRFLKKNVAKLFANRTGLQILSKVERATSRLLKTNDEYLRLFRELKPALVFNSSHVHSEIATQAVQAAQWLRIPTATFIFSWDNLTSQGRVMQPYNYYLVWNDALKKQLLEIYDRVRPEQVMVVGTPQFDFHFRQEFVLTREEYCSRIGADPSRPIVLYTTGMPNHMPGEPLVVEGIAQALREMTDLNPQLVVRVYPKDKTGRFEEVSKRNPDILFPAIPWEANWYTPLLEDSYLLSNMLRYCDAGINIASTVSLELCMFDKPIINIAYNPKGVDMGAVDFLEYYEFDHYKPIVQKGAVKVATSEKEMQAFLHEALLNPQTDQTQRQALIEKMFRNTLDGNAGTRIARKLVELSGKMNADKFDEQFGVAGAIEDTIYE